MVSSSQVNSHLNELLSELKEYESIMNGLSGSWSGASYDSTKTKAHDFLSEYTSALTKQMNSFSEAADYYQEYLQAKSLLESANNSYQLAVSNNDSDDISRYSADCNTYTNQVSQLKGKIESALHSAASIKLEATLTKDFSADVSLDVGEITFKSTRYAGTTVWYAVIPKDKMPKLGIANDNYDYLSNEAPSSIARRKNAKLAINFGLTGDPAGMIYADGRLVSDTGNRCDETLYMDQNGMLNSVRNDQYTTQDIIDMNPVWASKGFYTIARDGQYVDENTIDPSLSVDKHPRTFIGQDYEGNYIVGVCDGRGENEAGLTLREVYDFVTTEVTDDLRFLFNGDGGGSSAFIYDGEKLNSDTDGSERERPDLIYWT